MAFITDGTNILSFAEYSDVMARDQRVFDANEGLDEDDVEDLLIRSTERIMTILGDSTWWATYGPTDEKPDINLIIGRINDFNDLGVYYCLYEYLYPLIADFGTEDNSEVAKIDYYKALFDDRAKEIIGAGDFYDFSETGSISTADENPGNVEERRYR